MKVSWNCFWTNSVITYTQFISSLASCLVVQFEKVEVETKQRQNFNTSLARPRMQDIWKWNLPILCLKSSFGQHKPLVCIKNVHFLGRGKKVLQSLSRKKITFFTAATAPLALVMDRLGTTRNRIFGYYPESVEKGRFKRQIKQGAFFMFWHISWFFKQNFENHQI